MNSKRGLQILVLLILSLIFLGMQVGEVNAEDCITNPNIYCTNFIPCINENLAPNNFGEHTGECRISLREGEEKSTYFVDVNDSINHIIGKTWNIDKLVIDEGVTLWFMNSNPPTITPTSYAGQSSCNTDYKNIDCLGGNSGQSSPPPADTEEFVTFANQKVGDGGLGRDGDNNGGTGGGGGAGGLMFQTGGYGGKGTDGKPVLIYGSQAGGRPGVINDSVGANVSLRINELSLLGSISVSGFAGNSGENLPGARDNCGGGGGGAGGSGAGKLSLFVNKVIVNTGNILANGGNGGDGGLGGKEIDGNDHGCYGGGGGGGQGGIVEYQIMEGSINSPEVKAGKGGNPGNTGYGACSHVWEPPFFGKDGKTGQIIGGISELDPDNTGTVTLTNCNDGYDNEGDGLFNMDDYDCRIGTYDNIYYWDASIWDAYNSASNYNESSKNYTDYVCGDDTTSYCSQRNSLNSQGSCNLIPIKEWCVVNNSCEWTYLQNYNDIGGLSPDNEYLCLDSVYIPSQSGVSQKIWNPGNAYAWFNADGSLPLAKFSELTFSDYQIFQANQNQFISNGDVWYWCGATGTANYGSNKIEEFETFELSSAHALNYCTGGLQRIFDKENDEDKKVIECDDTPNNCLIKLEKQSADAWCNPKTFTPGHFMDDCGSACYYEIENPPYYAFISNYPFGGVLCEVFPYEDGCLSQLGFSGGDQEDYGDQDFCANFEDLCLGGVYNPGFSCGEIYSNFNYPYPEGGEGKICDSTQKCVGGDLIPSSDGRCCVGSNAYCEEYQQGDCVAMGGLVKPNNDEALFCNGVVVSDCCLYGNWIDLSQAQFKVNESFTCYAQEGNSYLQECCGGFDCYNTVNPLNGWNLPVSKLFSTNGVPLHSIANFDIYDAGADEPKIKRQVRTFRNRNFNDHLILSDELKYSFSLNWNNFESLDFDIMYTVYTDYYLHLEYEDQQNCNVSINNYTVVKKGPLRWQHVSIPIKELNRCTLSSLNGIYIVAQGQQGSNKVSVALDNFFLKTPGNLSNNDLVHSENRFCSGNWGDWVENLDGPDARGFVGENPELAEYGPYKDACNGVISFGWTGSVCCGDDTQIGKNGEFWSDTEGACWNGTAVYHNQAVYSALGLSQYSNNWQTSLHERSLLFYEGKLWSCNISENDLTENVSYDGINQDDSSTIGDVIAEVKDPYSIMGDWICIQEEGWTKLSEFNRVRPLAAALSAVGEAAGGNYTLMCGDYKEMSNQIGVLSEALSLTNYSCVLKAGKNDLSSIVDNDVVKIKFSRLKSTDGFVVLGLEVKDRELAFEEYKNNVLDMFDIMNIEDYTCSELSPNVGSDEFFTLCGKDNQNEFRIYYNKPLNLIILSGYDKDLSELGIEGFSQGEIPFLQRMWDSFKNFFNNLFKGERETLMLNDFDKPKNTRDFYLSKQGSRKISGALQESGSGGMMLRVEYVNFSSSVKILKDAIDSNYQGIQSYYESEGLKQAIFIEIPTNNVADWRSLTSILRVEMINKAPNDFGQLNVEPCFDSDADKEEDGRYVKGHILSYEGQKEDYCSDKNSLFEYVCDGSVDDVLKIVCTCDDGACDR